MNVVVDANLVISLAFPLPYTESASKQFQVWTEAKTKLYSPSLWSYEVISGLRKLVSTKRISAEKAEADLRDILALGIEEVDFDLSLHINSLLWAARLKQIVDYDTAYFALAEHLKAQFWTADQKIAQAAKQLGVQWVHSI